MQVAIKPLHIFLAGANMNTRTRRSVLEGSKMPETLAQRLGRRLQSRTGSSASASFRRPRKPLMTIGPCSQVRQETPSSTATNLRQGSPPATVQPNRWRRDWRESVDLIQWQVSEMGSQLLCLYSIPFVSLMYRLSSPMGFSERRTPFFPPFALSQMSLLRAVQMDEALRFERY